MLEYLQKLTNFYPQSGLQGNVKALLEYAGRELETCGFTVQQLEHNGIHSLYAHPQGKRHSRLLLQGHIDVVPGLNQPFRTEGDKIFGRGVYDMLYATACYLQLAHELRKQIPSLDLGIMLCGDEEIGGFDGVKAFLDDGYTTDVCILPDAGEGFGSQNIAAKGVYTVSVRIHGAAHHASRPWEGDGATAKLVDFLQELETAFDTSDRHNSTMTISRLNAGDADNRGPAEADCTLDIRFRDKADLQRIQDTMQQLLQKHNGEITEALHGDSYEVQLSHPDVQAFAELYARHHGAELRLTRAHGSSDARFFAARNIPIIMLRPDGGGGHGDKEWISHQSIDKFYALLKEYVLKTAIIETK